MMILTGWVILAAGCILLTVGLLKTPPRRRGISSGMIAQLIMPEYERRARQYCRLYGYSEHEWERFAHVAIAEIIRQGVR